MDKSDKCNIPQYLFLCEIIDKYNFDFLTFYENLYLHSIFGLKNKAQ